MIKLAAIGLGNRTRKYLKYILAHPETVRLEAIVDCDIERLEEIRIKYGMSPSQCFSNSSDFFQERRAIDAIIIGTPDHFHYQQCMAAIQKGYHILLEKPIAQTKEQCQEIEEAARKAGVKVQVCYVLRFHPYYLKLKEILQKGSLGKVIAIHHTINVGLDRMMHTFVRGPWGIEKDTVPIFLSKCCHDVDILLWLIEDYPVSVSSSGSLSWFRPENAPENSAERCIDCPIEEHCPFSAVDLYARRKVWIDNFIVKKGCTRENAVEEELRTGRYGRCAFRCGNDVMDHQVACFKTGTGVTIDMTMVTLTRKDGRNLRINCAYGEILAQDDMIKVHYFKNDKEECYDFTEINKLPLHTNADLKIVEDWLLSIENTEHRLGSPIHQAIESHFLCFMAEKSRISGVTQYKFIK